jgi:hypothetical protein
MSKCNNVPVSMINSGLPLREKKKMLTDATIKSERGLRDLIERNLRKEIHPHTKSSVDFIAHILDQAHAQGMSYDVTDMRGAIMAFANNSSNQALPSLQTVMKMKFKGGETTPDGQTTGARTDDDQYNPEAFVKDERLVFFDIEVYPNLFIVCWKYEGDENVTRMINPKPAHVEDLFKYKLVGFNNRRYDNHILYAAAMGHSVEQLYYISQKIISNAGGATFGEAYNLSYADIYDFSSKKQSLKLFEIELGLKHMEMNLPWDEPVPEELWEKVEEYCVNDVLATEATFNARRQDFVARQILAELSGLSVNSTTNQHTARIIFGQDKDAQRKFKYTDLSKDFPGYVFDAGKSTYQGELVGEGGYVYAEPGMYHNVITLDVASMHPASIIALDLFGPYTKNFAALRDARLAIKHKRLDEAREMMGGRLAPFLTSEDEADALAYALKIVINIVYGMTSAKFDNPFRDIRNKDNIVAKRGALFMIDLKHTVQARGFQVVHIKTDSIKIADATPELIDEIVMIGQKWGYDFEVEDIYEKFCLVNDAVYIAKKSPELVKPGKTPWTATGAQFAHPFVFKTLFSGEELVEKDYMETKSVAKGAMYLDFGATLPMYEAKETKMVFVGRTGQFIPVTEGSGGGALFRIYEGKPYAVTGTKGHLWVEAEQANFADIEIDQGYFEKLAYNAVKAIEKFGNFETFVS